MGKKTTYICATNVLTRQPEMATPSDEETEKKRLRALAIQRLTQKYGRPFLVFMMDEKLQSNNRAVPDQVQQLTNLIKDDTNLPDLDAMKNIATIAKELQSGSMKVADIPLQRNNEVQDETKSDTGDVDTTELLNTLTESQKIMALESQVEQLLEKNEKLEKENEVLNDFVDSSGEQYNQLLRQKVQLSEQNNKRQEALAEMMDKLNDAKAEIARLQGNSNVSTVSSAYMDQVRNETMERLRKENKELFEEVQQNEGRAVQLQQFLEAEEKKSKQLQSLVDDLKDKLRQCERSATGNGLKQKLKDCEEISKSLKNRLKTQFIELQNFRNNAVEKESEKIQELKEQLLDNENYIDELRVKNTDKVKRITEAKDQKIEQLRENMKNLSKKIKEIKESNSEKFVTDEIEKLKKSLERCKQKHVTKDQTITELGDEISGLQQRFEEYQLYKQVTEGEIETLTNKIQMLEKDLAQKLFANEDLRNEKEKLLIDLQKEQEECEKEKRRLMKRGKTSRPRRGGRSSDSGTSATDTDSDSSVKPEVRVELKPPPNLKPDCIAKNRANRNPPENFKSVSNIRDDVTAKEIVLFAKKMKFDPKKIRLHTNPGAFQAFKVNNYYCAIYGADNNNEGDSYVEVVNQNKEMVRLVIGTDVQLKDFYVNELSFLNWKNNFGIGSRSTKITDSSSDSGSSGTTSGSGSESGTTSSSSESKSEDETALELDAEASRIRKSIQNINTWWGLDLKVKEIGDEIESFKEKEVAYRKYTRDLVPDTPEWKHLKVDLEEAKKKQIEARTSPQQPKITNEYLNGLTKPQLEQLAKDKGVKLKSGDNKGTIKDKIRKELQITGPDVRRSTRRKRSEMPTEEDIASLDFMSMSDRFVMDYEEGVTPALYSARIPERHEMM